MKQKHVDSQSVERPLTQRMSLRTYGYLVAILLLGMVFGLLLYPLLTYPAVVGFVLLGVAILLMVLTAPLFRKQ